MIHHYFYMMSVQTELLTLLQRLTKELDPGLSTSTDQQNEQQHQQEIRITDSTWWWSVGQKGKEVYLWWTVKSEEENTKSTKAQIYAHVWPLYSCTQMYTVGNPVSIYT